jgi:multiple sugar transport system permease protein
MGAYAFARLKFRGKNKIFVGYIATMMIPFQIAIIYLRTH